MHSAPITRSPSTELLAVLMSSAALISDVSARP